MKAYKATYNGECLDITYEVGKIYTLTHGDLEMCKKGFHFCKNILDLTIWYNFIIDNKYNEEIKVFEIETLGEIIKYSDKFVINKIKIVKELDKEEILKGIKSIYKFDKNNNFIWEKNRNGYMWEYKYDKNNNMIWQKFPDGDIYENKYTDNEIIKKQNGEITERIEIKY